MPSVVSDLRWYRITPMFWRDERSAAWDSDTQLLALYLLSSPHRNIVGCFVLPREYIHADLRWDTKRLAQPFAKLLAEGFMEYDDTHSVMLICNAMKYDPPDNPNQAKAAVNQLKMMPRSKLLARLLTLSERFAERLTEPLREWFDQRYGDSLYSLLSPITEEPMCGSPEPHVPEPALPEETTTPKIKRHNYTPEFESFWQAYPPSRRVVKRDAFAKWKARLKEHLDSERGGEKVTADLLLRAAHNYAAECVAKRREPDKTKHPATFLSEKHPFADYLRPVAVVTQGEPQTVQPDGDALTREYMATLGVRP